MAKSSVPDQAEKSSVHRPGTVHLSGELDAAAVPHLRQQLTTLPAGRDLELDLSQVRFLGSAGLSLLLQTRQQLAHTGATLSLTGVPPALGRIVMLLGLQDLVASPLNELPALVPLGSAAIQPDV